jgi:hypothetical protein
LIYSDEWTEGLNTKQQNLVIDYVLNEGQIISDMEKYYSLRRVKKFFKSDKGRKAIRKYIEFKFDLKKDIVKMNLMKLHFTRAFFNPADIITPDGKFVDVDGEEIKSLRQLGKLAYCVEGIESKVIGFDEKTGKAVKELKIKLCDRNKSLDVIAKLFKIGEDEEEIDTDEKSIYEMSDEERDEEAKKLIQSDPKLIEFVKGNGDGQKE